VTAGLNSQGQPLIVEGGDEMIPQNNKERAINFSSLHRQSQLLTPLSSFPNHPTPSPDLPIHLFDLLLSYAHMCRLANGIWSTDVLHACEDLVMVSSVLRQCISTTTPIANAGALSSLRGMMTECFAAVRRRDGSDSVLAKGMTALGYANDVVKIMGSRVLVVAALCDMSNVVQETLMEVAEATQGKSPIFFSREIPHAKT